jgi:hypothetical protein
MDFFKKPIDIKKVVPSNRNRSGKYKVQNPEKYLGDLNNVVYRSSYERAFCVWCDESDDITKWESEPFAIPYISQVDNKQHHYFIDFYAKIKDATGQEVDYLIEVKPKSRLVRPIYPKPATSKKIKSFNDQAKEYIRNLSKFAAAKKYAASIGYKFIIVTEDHLFNR